MKMTKFISPKSLWISTGFILFAVALGSFVDRQKVIGGEAEAQYIDTHVHLCPNIQGGAGSVEEALGDMAEFGIQKSILMPTPGGDSACDAGDLAPVIYAHPDNFASLGGGKDLVPLISETPANAVDSAVLGELESRALAILRSGASGFGELAALHLSLRPGHPFIGASPDHPLFLRLAEIGALYGVPMDLHMEALTEDILLSDLCDISTACWHKPGTSNPNPSSFTANIAALETLLLHERRTRIVWAHAGWDNTGKRTVELMRRLLSDHPNLYMNIKLRGRSTNRPLDEELRLKTDWLDLIRSFPSRFTIGTDFKYPDDDPDIYSLTRILLNQLPPDLARKVGYLNAIKIYNLNKKMICHRPGSRAQATIWVDASASNAHMAHGDHVGPC